MTRVTWSVEGTRIFETGVDRGMLYVPPFAGVPWSGLTGVSESPSGGDNGEYFIDGDKYLQVPKLAEYTAVINAFASPVEFASCAGMISLSPGLYATNQPRSAFGFSYRSLVGNDIVGTSLGYKLHIVYNTTAKTSDFARESVSESPNVKPGSWEITSVPEAVDGFKPTAHFILDSIRVDPVILSAIEDILYGTVSADPRLLSVSELVTMVGS